MVGSFISDSFLKAILQTPFWPRRLWAKVFRAHPQWRPGVVAALGLLLAAMVLLSIWRWPSAPAVTAAELLQKSIAAETQTAATRGQATHRGLTLEERDPATARIIASRRIEIWQSADRGITARRLYDELNRVIAGQWKQADGASKLYQRRAKTGGKDSTDINYGIGGNALWQTALAPESFANLVGAAAANLEERKDSYVLSYEFPAGAAANLQLLKATLVLNKSDLRAIEQTMLVREAELREYRAVESKFEQLPASSVPANVFQPDPELLASGAQLIEATPANSKAEAVGQPAAGSTAPNAAELAALEIEARYLLDQVNANLGEQVSFTREGSGKLRIAALVETDKRKAELIGALTPLRANPAAAFDIATYAEAARRAPRTNGALTISEFEASQNQSPAAADLRRYFAEAARQSQGAQQQSNEWIESRIAEFTNNIQAQAMKPLRHARALKTLVEQISPAELAQLNPEAKAKWRQMVQSHALAAQRETAELRAALQPIFFAATVQDPTVASGNELNLKQAIERLVALTAHHDTVIGQAFARSAAPASAATLKSNQFWQSLLEAEAVAKVISKQQ